MTNDGMYISYSRESIEPPPRDIRADEEAVVTSDAGQTKLRHGSGTSNTITCHYPRAYARPRLMTTLTIFFFF